MLLDRPLLLVSGVNLPMEAESVPFHLLGGGPPDAGQTLVHLIGQQPLLWEMFGQFLASLHPEIVKELEAMAKTSKKGPQFHLKPLANLMGMDEVIRQLGKEKVIDELLSNVPEAERATSRAAA